MGYPKFYIRCPKCRRKFWGDDKEWIQKGIAAHISTGQCSKEQKDLEYTKKILAKTKE